MGFLLPKAFIVPVIDFEILSSQAQQFGACSINFKPVRSCTVTYRYYIQRLWVADFNFEPEGQQADLSCAEGLSDAEVI